MLRYRGMTHLQRFTLAKFESSNEYDRREQETRKCSADKRETTTSVQLSHGCLTTVCLAWHHFCMHRVLFRLRQWARYCMRKAQWPMPVFSHTWWGNASQGGRTWNTALFRAVSSFLVAGNWFPMSHNSWHERLLPLFEKRIIVASGRNCTCDVVGHLYCLSCQ